MNAFSPAERGYAANAETTQSGRRAEYALIAKLTHRLRATAQTANRNYTAYVQALHDNRKLWSTLAIDVADADNALPDALRARVFYLSE